MTYRKYRTKETAKFFQPIGNSETPDTTAVTVIEKDSSDNVLRATGTTVPGSEAGFSKGCIFIKTDAGAGTEGFYRNIGTTAASSFEALDTITPTEIALAEGSVLLGNASSKAAAFDASGDTKVLVGNATTITSVALSGDVTMANDGATTVAALDLETATVTNITDTELLIGTGAGTANFATLSGDVTIANTGDATVAALDLETATVTNIVDTEIMIGTGAGTANFAVMSGEITMTNGGVTTVGVLASGKIVRATNDTAVGASFILDHVSASPAALDVIGTLIGRGQNSISGIVDYGTIGFGIVSATSGTEIGGLSVTLQNGSGAYPTNAQFTINGGSGGIGVTRENEAAEGAAITLTQVSATAAANDEVGYVKFVGNNDDSPVDLVEYAQIAGIITDVTNDAEFGQGRFKAINGTGTTEVAGGWANNGSYGQLIAGSGSGQGEFVSMGDNDVILATGNAVTGSLTITDGADGAITLAPNGAGTIELEAVTNFSSTVNHGTFASPTTIVKDVPLIMISGDVVADQTSGVTRGAWFRTKVSAAQSTCSILGIEAQCRINDAATLGAGQFTGSWNYFEQSGTTALNTGCLASGASNTVETASTFTIDSGAILAGQVIDSSVDAGIINNGTFVALYIKKGSGKLDFVNGIEFTDCLSDNVFKFADDGEVCNDTDTGAAASLDKDDISGYITVETGTATRYIYTFAAKPSAV